LDTGFEKGRDVYVVRGNPAASFNFFESSSSVQSGIDLLSEMTNIRIIATSVLLLRHGLNIMIIWYAPLWYLFNILQSQDFMFKLESFYEINCMERLVTKHDDIATSKIRHSESRYLVCSGRCKKKKKIFSRDIFYSRYSHSKDL